MGYHYFRKPLNGLINTLGLTWFEFVLFFFHAPRNKWSYYFPTYDWFCLGPNSVGSLFCSRLILCKRWYFILNLFQKHKSEMNRKLMHTIPNHFAKKRHLFSQFFHSASFFKRFVFFCKTCPKVLCWLEVTKVEMIPLAPISKAKKKEPGVCLILTPDHRIHGKPLTKIQVPYQCMSHLGSWEHWSPPKRHYCCAHYAARSWSLIVWEVGVVGLGVSWVFWMFILLFLDFFSVGSV